MFDQSLHVTRSPNHWCASSCESRSSEPRAVLAGQRRIYQTARRQRCRAGIFHAAFNEIVYRSLCVLRPRILHVQFVGEKIQHSLGARKRRVDRVFLAPGHNVAHRNSVPGFLLFHEFTRNRSDQVRRKGWSCFQVQVFVPSDSSFMPTKSPLDTVIQLAGTVIIISEVVRSFG